MVLLFFRSFMELNFLNIKKTRFLMFINKLSLKIAYFAGIPDIQRNTKNLSGASRKLPWDFLLKFRKSVKPSPRKGF